MISGRRHNAVEPELLCCHSRQGQGQMSRGQFAQQQPYEAIKQSHTHTSKLISSTPTPLGG